MHFDKIFAEFAVRFFERLHVARQLRIGAVRNHAFVDRVRIQFDRREQFSHRVVECLRRVRIVRVLRREIRKIPEHVVCGFHLLAYLPHVGKNRFCRVRAFCLGRHMIVLPQNTLCVVNQRTRRIPAHQFTIDWAYTGVILTTIVSRDFRLRRRIEEVSFELREAETLRSMIQLRRRVPRVARRLFDQLRRGFHVAILDCGKIAFVSAHLTLRVTLYRIILLCYIVYRKRLFQCDGHFTT